MRPRPTSRKLNLVGMVLFALGLVTLGFQAPALAAAFVKFDGVDGEAKDKTHKTWSDMLSFREEGTTGSGGRSKARHKSFVITKELDKSSLKLADAMYKGKAFRSVKIDLTASHSDAGRATYYSYVLRNVRVTSYAIEGSGQAENVPVETITLTFDQMLVTYVEHDRAGRKKGTVKYSWKAR